jgi:uncharacterized protein YrzB (UPF0473 family)
LKKEKITFTGDNGETQDFYVEEETRVAGTDYLLVSDSEDDEAEAIILKDVSDETDPEGKYVIVDDDTEFDAIARIFEQMLDDTDLRME